jgi:hypothetical protein
VVWATHIVVAVASSILSWGYILATSAYNSWGTSVSSIVFSRASHRLRVLLTCSKRTGNYGEFLLNSRVTYVRNATSAASCISRWHRTSVHQVQYPGFKPRTSTCAFCVNTALLPQYVPLCTYCGKSAVFTQSANRTSYGCMQLQVFSRNPPII